MINPSYLLITENIIRRLKKTPNEKYADELRLDYFGTIIKVLNISKKDSFYKNYQAEIGKKYDELYNENEVECYNFELVIKDLEAMQNS